MLLLWGWGRFWVDWAADWERETLRSEVGVLSSITALLFALRVVDELGWRLAIWACCWRMRASRRFWKLLSVQ